MHINKIYYSIGEVVSILGEPGYVIRKWEKHFDCLKPKRRSNSQYRQYTESDLEILKRIQSLLRLELYTIQGARNKMQEIIASQNNSRGIESKNQLAIVS